MIILTEPKKKEYKLLKINLPLLPDRFVILIFFFLKLYNIFLFG